MTHEHTFKQIRQVAIPADTALADQLRPEIVNPVVFFDPSKINPEPTRDAANSIVIMSRPIEEYRKALLGFVRATFLCACGETREVDMVGGTDQ